MSTLGEDIKARRAAHQGEIHGRLDTHHDRLDTHDTTLADLDARLAALEKKPKP